MTDKKHAPDLFVKDQGLTIKSVKPAYVISDEEMKQGKAKARQNYERWKAERDDQNVETGQPI